MLPCCIVISGENWKGVCVRKKKKDKILFRGVRIGNRRAVRIGHMSDGSYILEFQRPITKRTDLKGGLAVTRAGTVRRKNQLITQVKISEDAFDALRILCDEEVKRVSWRDRMISFLTGVAEGQLSVVSYLAEIEKSMDTR